MTTYLHSFRLIKVKKNQKETLIQIKHCFRRILCLPAFCRVTEQVIGSVIIFNVSICLLGFNNRFSLASLTSIIFPCIDEFFLCFRNRMSSGARPGSLVPPRTNSSPGIFPGIRTPDDPQVEICTHIDTHYDVIIASLCSVFIVCGILYTYFGKYLF